MTDVHDKATRSYNMSMVKGKDTKPEMTVRRFLHANGLRYRLHVKDLPGKPDIVLPKYKTIVLVNGCFWHGHEGCKRSMLPKTRTEWWKKKIDLNVDNDRKSITKLKQEGWNIIIIWECNLNAFTALETLKSLLNGIRSGIN